MVFLEVHFKRGECSILSAESVDDFMKAFDQGKNEIVGIAVKDELTLSEIAQFMNLPVSEIVYCFTGRYGHPEMGKGLPRKKAKDDKDTRISSQDAFTFIRAMQIATAHINPKLN